MSDMVQQPVIQLVQELTMTAVVERHDCTDSNKRKIKEFQAQFESRNPFSIPQFLENIT